MFTNLQKRTYNQGEQPEAENGQAAKQINFIDSLYNWQDSTSAIFKEVNEEKKKMPSV